MKSEDGDLDYENIEEALTQKGQNKEKRSMTVSGRSVFLLKKLIENKKRNENR